MSSTSSPLPNAPQYNERPLKRKSAGPSRPANERAEKKRVQNRISQQRTRGKQAAYIRQMESFIDMLKANADTQDSETRYSRLLKAHLKLLEEQRDRESAFFRLRHKFLSLANLATAAAEDQVFTELTKQPADRETHNLSLPLDGIASTDAASCTTACNENLGSQPLEGHLLSNSQQSEKVYDSIQTPSLWDHPGPPDLSMWATEPALSSQLDAIFDHQLIQPEISGPPNLLASPQLRFPFGAFDVNAAASLPIVPSTLQMPSLSGIFGEPDPAVINNSTVFADEVKSAARHIMSTSTEGFGDESSNEHSGLETTSAQLVERLASAAVEVIGALAGLESYIYGVQFSKYMEYVLRWRISDNPDYRLAIPLPFRPTPLQSATPNHPTVIDFINWPSIRDQMILYRAHLDLDAMSRDIVLNTVVEIPQQRVSVNIYELFFSCILPQVRGSNVNAKNSMLHNTEWVYLKVSPASDPPGFSSSRATQETLATKMTSRMGLVHQHSTSMGQSGLTAVGETIRKSSAQRAAPCGPQMRVARMLAWFGIDQPCNWKLSKGFARMYPLIDCSLDVSQYEMANCAALQFKHTDI